MSNAFELLGLEPRLDLSPERVTQAFRDAGKRLHPDGGGDQPSFAALQQACDTLLSPSRRLKHWLELRSHPLEARGTIQPAVMDAFARVGAVCQRAEAVVRRRQAVKSALGLALLEPETQSSREELESTMAGVAAHIEQLCGAFALLDAGRMPPAEADGLYRDLAFLEKWLISMRGLYTRLF